MGDVIGSSRMDAIMLRRQFRSLLTDCNRKMKKNILSPLTTTLGDEFQGIVQSLSALPETIFFLDDTIRTREYGFHLRYIAHAGVIQTRINRKTAYGMMGPGLARARALLTEKQRGLPRVIFDLPAQGLAENLTKLFMVLDGLASRWKPCDYALVQCMLRNSSNQDVAKEFGKDRSQIWKRRKQLHIEEFRILRSLVLSLIEKEDAKK
ncbi:MAG: SatD family protein [Candidatus Sumerlaeota bacterium]|nr:SatD family protein [Candidatus Sumerlaeota bacterium]